MNNPIVMWCKQNNCDVNVYEMNINDKNCLVYNPQLAGSQCGNGWQIIPRKNLIPYPYAETYKIPAMTKTKYNKAKSHLHLLTAIWEATDGAQFNHEHIEDAVTYQMALDNIKEKEINE